MYPFLVPMELERAALKSKPKQAALSTWTALDLKNKCAQTCLKALKSCFSKTHILCTKSTLSTLSLGCQPQLTSRDVSANSTVPKRFAGITCKTNPVKLKRLRRVLSAGSSLP